MVQWLRLSAPNAGGMGSILVGELRSRMWHSAAKKKKKKAGLRPHPIHLLSVFQELCFYLSGFCLDQLTSRKPQRECQRYVDIRASEARFDKPFLL